MNTMQKIPPVAVTIFGAAGDLTWRKLVPALYNLYLDQRLPEDFLIIGLDNDKISRKKLARPHLNKHEPVSLQRTDRYGHNTYDKQIKRTITQLARRSGLSRIK